MARNRSSLSLIDPTINGGREGQTLFNVLLYREEYLLLIRQIFIHIIN